MSMIVHIVQLATSLQLPISSFTEEQLQQEKSYLEGKLDRSGNYRNIVTKLERNTACVTSLLSGEDGCSNAIYEVLYGNDEDIYVIDYLVDDFKEGAVQCLDIQGNYM